MNTKRKPRRRPVLPVPPLRAVVVKDEIENPPPGTFVNRVVLDNTVPGGFRYEQVPSKPGVTG